MDRRLEAKIRKGMSAKQIVAAMVDHTKRRVSELQDAVEPIAKEAASEIRRNIRDGRIAPKNDREWKAWKRRHGKSGSPLMCDQDYVRSIKAKKVKKGLYKVSPGEGNHPGSGLPYDMLSKILEHGTLDGIPERPHFGPAMRRARAKLAQRIGVKK